MTTTVTHPGETSPAGAPLPVLDVAHLSVSVPVGAREALAVDDVSFAIAPGRTLGLVGESGSGKSMTARALVRLLEPPARLSGGTVRVLGREVAQLDEPALCAMRGGQVGFIFQEPMTAMNPTWTVRAHLDEALALHSTDGPVARRRAALALLDAVRIPDPIRCLHAFPHELSGGMRQRVLIAAALACQPALVIADEPTTALDVTIQAEILDLLAELQRVRGIALLLISHDLGVVARMAHEVAVMYAGRLVETGPTRDVLQAPQHPYTRGLLAAIPRPSQAGPLQAIPGSVPPLGALPSGCAFHPRCSDARPSCAVEAPAVVHRAHRAVRCVLADGQA